MYLQLEAHRRKIFVPELITQRKNVLLDAGGRYSRLSHLPRVSAVSVR